MTNKGNPFNIGKIFNFLDKYFSILLVICLIPIPSTSFAFPLKAVAQDSKSIEITLIQPKLLEETSPTPTPEPDIPLDLSSQSADVAEIAESISMTTYITGEGDSLLNQTEKFIDELVVEFQPMLYSENDDGFLILPEKSVNSSETAEIALSEQAKTEEKFIEYIIKIGPESSLQELSDLFTKYGVQVEREVTVLNTQLLKIGSENLEGFLEELQTKPGIEYIEENSHNIAMLEIPNDPFYSMQYGLEAINAPVGWALKKASASVTIAILDTGIDLDHPDLVGAVVAGFNILQGNDFTDDDNGHGTQVAGICAAVTDNGQGIAGVSWGAAIMPVKVLDRFGNGSFQNVADGIIWAVDHGAQVLNLSLGGTTPSLLMEDAIKYAVGKGAVVVAAAGNKGVNILTYPAQYEPVIAVGATGSDNQVAGFSNFGPELDVVAPGGNIYTLNNQGGYGYMTGTSAATPFTSGLAAILLSVKGNSSINVVKQLCNSALDLGELGMDAHYGCGLIQADKALRLALPIINKKSDHYKKNISNQTILVLPLVVDEVNTNVNLKHKDSGGEIREFEKAKDLGLKETSFFDSKRYLQVISKNSEKESHNNLLVVIIGLVIFILADKMISLRKNL